MLPLKVTLEQIASSENIATEKLKNFKFSYSLQCYINMHMSKTILDSPDTLHTYWYALVALNAIYMYLPYAVTDDAVIAFRSIYLLKEQFIFVPSLK